MPKIPFWVFVVVAIIYFTAVRVDTMDVDASQYAEMSREMLRSGDYLHVYDRGMEYLDKPPILFWVSALSMKVFGVNTFWVQISVVGFCIACLVRHLPPGETSVRRRNRPHGSINISHLPGNVPDDQ